MAAKLQPLAQRLIVQLGSIHYLVRNRIEFELPGNTPSPVTSPAPAVIITLDSTPISLAAIHEKFTQFKAADDVYSDAFNTGGYLIVQHPCNQFTGTLPTDVKEYLNGSSTKLLTLDETLPEGPYFVLGNHLHQAWRLHPDVLSAFAVAVLPDDVNASSMSRSHSVEKYQAFQNAAFTDAAAAVSVPVPSRLYYQKTSEQPFAGLRVAIKDNMHLAGIVTGLGSRAYAELYGKKDVTSQYVSSLEKKGAVIVGKTKLSAFAGSEVPPNQCIDYFPPWNARGDGYQGPSGSSSGAAAVMGGYPWIDVSLCTDSKNRLISDFLRADIL
ncbi:hypothetical protein GT037_011049 [Alternaria burnsii]|uniref:Amidase domain-containing protein n=1 Tax=Alternaria burnsii TaxID=1187904 RepID=A0A8H7AST6_9PLEO|nr:uncharacterized protein GT037_011049 [Alternaria burnsii]KAF7670921.1 hypothetical protein GT037_011049 [Alternaria burnsii]